jgi:hypothetical protein
MAMFLLVGPPTCARTDSPISFCRHRAACKAGCDPNPAQQGPCTRPDRFATREPLVSRKLRPTPWKALSHDDVMPKALVMAVPPIH